MLDQNTDRMWYVIGAVLVGAAIILIANGTIPEIFASVSNSFEEVSNTATDEIQEMYESYEDVGYTLYTTGSVDQSSYGRTGELIIDEMSQRNSSVFMKVDDLELKPDTTYIMTYSFQKLEGEMWGIGGHTDVAYNDNIFYLNDNRMPAAYRSSLAWTKELSELVNAGGEHHIRVRFTTPHQLVSDEQTFDQYDGRIYIQPNRMDTDGIGARVRVWDLNMQEVVTQLNNEEGG